MNLRIPNNSNLFLLDIRALSLMRIFVAITLFVDLIIRTFNIEAHYTDKGVLPLEVLFRYLWNSNYFSFYTTNNSWHFQIGLFCINYLCIGFLLIGYRTKLFTFLCWIFLISIHNRNPLIHQGGDDLLRLLLFWGMFLPWGYYYSIDGNHSHKIDNDGKKIIHYRSIAVLGYILQIIYVYFFSALLKTSAEWTQEFSALYYALSFDQIVLPGGKFIYPYYELLQYLTRLVYYVEFIVPFFLLIPILIPYFRIAFIVIIFGLHVGISLTLNVGLFPLVASIAMIGLIPSGVINYLSKLTWTQHFKNSLTIISSIGLKGKGYNIPSLNVPKEMLALFFLVFMLFWNIKTTGKVKILSETSKVDWIAYIPRIDQHWGMFAPAVFKDDGWFIFEGEMNNGQKYDILNLGEEVSENRPEELPVLFRSDRWRKYSENFLLVVNSHFRPFFCFYLIHNWNHNNNGENQMKALNIYYVKEVSLPAYQTGKPTKELLCNCAINVNVNEE